MKQLLVTIPFLLRFSLVLGVLVAYSLVAHYSGSMTLQISNEPVVNKFITLHTVGFCMMLVMVLLSLVLNPDARQYLHWGQWTNLASPDKLIGISKPTPWSRVFLTSGLVITLTTAAFMWMGLGEQFSWQKFHAVWPWVMLLSATNAMLEELMARYGVVAFLGDQQLTHHLNPQQLAIASAILFGGIHYWGAPGGPIGVLMAGYLAYFLTKAMVETKGISIPFLIHFLQDVVILTFLLGRKE